MSDRGVGRIDAVVELLLLLAATNVMLAERLLRNEMEAELGTEVLAAALAFEELEDLSAEWRLKT